MVALFGVVLPIGTTIYCMGFCCARGLIERCHCCCALCKQPNCGSHRPTTDYDAKEKVCISVCVLIMLLVFLVVSMLGFLSTMQMTTDFQEIMVAIK